MRLLGGVAAMFCVSLAACGCGTSEEAGSVGDELTANGLAITVLEVDRRVPRPERDVTGLALPSPGYELVGVRVRACNEHGSALGPWAFGVDGADGTKARPKYPTRNYARAFEPVRDACGSGWLVFELPKGVRPAKVRFDFHDTGGVRPGTDREGVNARFEWKLDGRPSNSQDPGMDGFPMLPHPSAMIYERLRKLTRRDVLRGATAIACASAAVPAQAGSRGGRPWRPPPLDGELVFDDEVRKAAADDFGHIVHQTPMGVLLPGSADDVAATIRWAARCNRGFAPQGQSHSTFGRAQARDGIVADMSMLRHVGPVLNDRVVVDAGAKWSELLDVTLAHGLTPPVLTDYLELSVGGTLVVGGVGGTTSAFGVQSDNVIELEVVTGEGEKVTCSATSNAELFDAVRAGLGQVGVITRATLELVAAPESVRRFLLFYPDLATMVNDARLLSRDRRFDAVQGAVVPTPSGGFAYRLDAAKYFDRDRPADDQLLAGLSDDPGRREPTTTTYRAYLNRLAPLEAALRANGQWFYPHPWLTTFVGDSRVESVVNAELSLLDPAVDLGQFGQIVLSPIRTSAISSTLMRIPPDELCFAFNLIRIPATDSRDEATRLVKANKATYKRVKAAGGTLYPVSALPLSSREWRDHLGPAFAQLDAAKQKFDPGNTLTPGYEIF